MTWLRVQVDVAEACVEPLENLLTALGAVSTELSDAGDQPILEPAPETTPLWKRGTNHRFIRILTVDEIASFASRMASVAGSGAPLPASLASMSSRTRTGLRRLRDELVPAAIRSKAIVGMSSGQSACPDPEAVGDHDGTGTRVRYRYSSDDLTCALNGWTRIVRSAEPYGSRLRLRVRDTRNRQPSHSAQRHVTAVDIDAQALRCDSR